MLQRLKHKIKLDKLLKYSFEVTNCSITVSWVNSSVDLDYLYKFISIISRLVLTISNHQEVPSIYTETNIVYETIYVLLQKYNNFNLLVDRLYYFNSNTYCQSEVVPLLWN